MASPYQQQALRRKIVYIVLIVTLFTVAGVFRKFVVEARAKELTLLEQDVGEVEVAGAAMELSLTGSRGFVISALWYWAQEAQKRNRWNELELYATSLTRLQPHFIAPWLFQTWNLSYNVAVEADQVKDKYFYVSRGVQLLAKGERKNHCNPDMRFNIGFYQQHKVMQSDETNVFRCLYQMSCMPYPERDPERLGPKDASGRRVIDQAAFEKFCADHPQFVRRLHDRLRCGKPEDVVAFLDDNKDIPSLFVDDPDKVHAAEAQGLPPPKKEDHLERFPVLPPPAPVRRLELPAAPGAHLYDEGEISYENDLKDDVDAYAVARAWYAYAQDPIPAPDPVLPGITTKVVDRARQRNPRMTTSLFRNHPPRAQSYVAERLQDEGWFGPEGWQITGWFPRDRFPDGRPAVVGGTQNWAEESWGNAYEWWRRRAADNHLLNDAVFLTEMHRKGLAYMTSRGLEIGLTPGAEPPADSPDHEGWFAARFIYELEYTLRLTNTLNFYHRALVEKEPEATQQSLIEARRTMFQARQSVRQGQRDRAAELFESKTGLERLRLILERFPDFRKDQNNQEAFYELQIRYVKLMQEKDGPNFRQLAAAGHLLGGGLPLGAAPAWPGQVQQALMTDDNVMPRLPVPEFVPPDRMRVDLPGKGGTELVGESAIYQIKLRHGLIKPRQPPREAMAGLRPPPPPAPDKVAEPEKK
jgi:hypothetical protein